MLYATFINTHDGCLQAAAGGPFTHLATVPSTRQRPGVHPLEQIITVAHGSARRIMATANPAHGNAREFVTDRFHLPPFPTAGQACRLLLVEDLWGTGARAQAMAHALRRAGATAVVIVAIGRQINHGHPPNQPILHAAARVPFDLNRCALDDMSA